MAEIRELEENQKACENQEPLTKEEEEKIQAVRDQLGTDFCRRCNYCAPCSVGIQIPSVFLFAGYLQLYDLEQWARDRYSTLKVKASACSGCGSALLPHTTIRNSSTGQNPVYGTIKGDTLYRYVIVARKKGRNLSPSAEIVWRYMISASAKNR